MNRFAAALGALLLATGSTVVITAAIADGRGDWHGYAWQTIAAGDCAPQLDNSLLCPPFHEKWDWKRDQWVDITIAFDADGQTLRLRSN